MTTSAAVLKPALAPTAAAPLGARLRRELAAFDVAPAQGDDIAAARQFAAQLIGEGIVAAADLERVHHLTGDSALFVTREEGELTGVLAFVLLNVSGLRAVLTGAFDALSPAAEHVAGPGQPACAFYGWGVAATTKPSARRVIDGARAIMGGAFCHLPKFARPTTEAGHRLMRERLGFEDLPGSFDGLVWQAPMEQAAAA
ncbi:hypothetical protein [Phenylobacterium sp.]|uniref:hypothetical protein n=1 Tax=Phenylobacterium sp. TaxID=1871053 RepID=UPI002C335EFF|nr:hypothetical protein [Phenylobacterium sp.]HLZ73880.1 hypothetical protein [Phenylobacterium sp.]